MALKRRENVLLVGLTVAVAIFLFDRFFDTPTNRKISNLKEEIKAADAKLSEFARLSRGVEIAEAELLRMEEELKRLSGRTLRGEEFRTFLRHLGRESDPLQMKVISLVPSEEKIAPSEEKKGTISSQVRKVKVQLVLHSTFAKIQSYLKGLEELPFLIQIDGLQIERTEEAHPFLRVTLNLKMYLIAL